MSTIHEKIIALYAHRNITMKDAAGLCGINYTTFRSMIINQRAIPHTTLEALARAFSVPFDYFSDAWPILRVETDGDADQVCNLVARKANFAIKSAALDAAKQRQRLTLKSFLNWWVAHSGRLENFDQISDHVDLFEVPDSTCNTIQPTQVGRLSLASYYFELEETEHLRETLNGFTPETNEALIKAHIEACNRGEPIITHPTLDETLRNGQRFSRQYRRVMAPLFLPGGKTLLANYSEDII